MPAATPPRAGITDFLIMLYRMGKGELSSCLSWLMGKHSTGNKYNFDSGQSKCKVCSYILKHRERN